jgi:hypothetical protein
LIPNDVLIAALQAVATSLLLASLWFVRSLYQRQADVEKRMEDLRRDTAKEIAALRLATTERLVKLETWCQNHHDIMEAGG